MPRLKRDDSYTVFPIRLRPSTIRALTDLVPSQPEASLTEFVRALLSEGFRARFGHGIGETPRPTTAPDPDIEITLAGAPKSRKSRRTPEHIGGYESQGEPITVLPPVPAGPAPGAHVNDLTDSATMCGRYSCRAKWLQCKCPDRDERMRVARSAT